VVVVVMIGMVVLEADIAVGVGVDPGESTTAGEVAEPGDSSGEMVGQASLCLSDRFAASALQPLCSPLFYCLSIRKLQSVWPRE